MNTPETDALEKTPLFLNRPRDPICGEALLHARKLETERNEARKQRDELLAALDLSVNLNCVFLQQYEDFADVVFTATNKDTGIEQKISAQEILEKAIKAIANVKGETV